MQFCLIWILQYVFQTRTRVYWFCDVGDAVGPKASNKSSYVGEDCLTGSPGKV